METQPSEKDKQLWRIAKKRVRSKRHLGMYVIVNILFWLVWFISERDNLWNKFPWPVWPMLGWGVGLSFNFLGAYVYTGNTAIEKEYEKLKGE